MNRCGDLRGFYLCLYPGTNAVFLNSPSFLELRSAQTTHVSPEATGDAARVASDKTKDLTVKNYGNFRELICYPDRRPAWNVE